jgi:hypothetical protein
MSGLSILVCTWKGHSVTRDRLNYTLRRTLTHTLNIHTVEVGYYAPAA